MSNKASSPSVGGTLAAGIQDVAAILPLIGTEQCEKHVGSALTGGYLYAAAAPLSIFGSLGIVKAGIAILISSISISIPLLSISFHDFIPSFKYSGQRKWLGGRMLKDAGFELTGVVAPLIGMDGHRFKAETRLIEMLEDKHIDDPEKITVDWKSRQWNMMLVVSTILGAALSLLPYIALLLGLASWRPTSMHLPWLFPALRIVGSCTATVTSQFIIQSRVISVMKNRILFMIIDRHLNAKYKQGVDVLLKDPKLKWDSSLPAEQCIWSLEQYISANGPLARREEDSNNEQDHPAVQKDAPCMSERKSEDSDMSERASGGSDHLSIQMATPLPDSSAVPTQTSSAPPTASSAETPSFDINDLHRLQQEHFPTPTLDAALIALLWILLGLSLPATVAGYIGCFTLVSATPTLGNGPLVWVGLEAALSILRIFIWASNPSFDEETEVRLHLKLSEHQPMVTTEDYNPWMTHFTHDKKKPFTLVPEREFLEWITPFTGPLDQYQKADNITLYFTLTTQYETNFSPWDEAVSTLQPEFMSLFMTVFDSNMQIGVSFMFTEECFHYFDVVVKYDTISRKLEANVQSEKRDTHPWRIEDVNMFDSLEIYYHYVIGAFNQRDINKSTASLPWKWDLSQRSGAENRGNNISRSPTLLLLTTQDRSFLNRGYEHQLKTDLVMIWSRWIVEDMRTIRSHTRLDCHEALRDVTSEKAKWELTELDTQLVWGWVERELVLLMLSKQLEDILRAKMEACASAVNRVQKERQLGVWMFESGRRKRMEQERGAAKKRMEKATKDASEQADTEGRPWQGDPSFLPQWRKAIEFVDNQWSAAISDQWDGLRSSEDELKRMIKQGEQGRWFHEDRHGFVAQLMNRVSNEHWRPQHQVEKQLMKATVARIRIIPADSARRDILTAYEYPEPDNEATVKFAELQDSSSQGKACSAIVYDTRRCGKEAVCEVIAKSTTRSVLNVDPEILPSILPNDHLLFLTCKDGKGEEPAFIQQNRDRWWEEQTTDSVTFYFTPTFIDGESCCLCSDTVPIAIAHILVFLTVPSAIRVSVLSRSHNDNNGLSIQENEKVLGSTVSDIRSNFQLHNFQLFVLQPGRHELELVPQGFGPFDYYYLRDILIELSDDPTMTSASTETSPGVLNLPSVEDPELTVYNGWMKYLPRTGNKP